MYVHKFSLDPEEYKPTGTASFSRIDHAVLEENYKKSQQKKHSEKSNDAPQSSNDTASISGVSETNSA